MICIIIIIIKNVDNRAPSWSVQITVHKKNQNTVASRSSKTLLVSQFANQSIWSIIATKTFSILDKI